MQLLENLKWRYATKKMDVNKKVVDTNLEKIREAVQLSASSYGLQPYKIIEITNAEMRSQLQPLCWNQSQITDASALWVFCNQVNVDKQDIEQIINLKAAINKIEKEQLAGYGSFVEGKLQEKSKEEMHNWTAKQTYIALSNALMACAELKIDCTPMEGFETLKVNEFLNLNSKGLNACLILAIGYRSDDDKNQHLTKVRRPIHQLFEKL